MVKIEYVYEKPKRPYKKMVAVLALLILIAFALGFIYSYFNLDYIVLNNTYQGNNTNQTFENEQNNTEPPAVPEDYENIVIPPEYEGPEGLEYIRTNYGNDMEEAEILCREQFSGEWRDTTSEMGCYNMQDFLTLFCEAETIRNLINLCDQINGDSICSSDTVSCTV